MADRQEKKPRIGIVTALGKTKLPWVDIPTVCVHRKYIEAVEKNGGIPLLLSVTENPDVLASQCELCDGFLFPGGEDVDPRMYNQEPDPLLGSVNLHIDRFWAEIFAFASLRNLPVLGICRGMQLINAILGGTLCQDISYLSGRHLLHVQKQERDYLMHQVKLTEGSLLQEILGEAEIRTNTMHHQCVLKEGKDMYVSARSKDQIIEALENRDKHILLVQWHPEELLDSEPKMNQLFCWLITVAAKK
ncbi:MAG: gamma-glutamyl-gamma-aminobutyrate hydrolase family protein [Anaerovoracaceae bacterium]